MRPERKLNVPGRLAARVPFAAVTVAFDVGSPHAIGNGPGSRKVAESAAPFRHVATPSSGSSLTGKV
jgi:hypothetical protein